MKSVLYVISSVLCILLIACSPIEQEQVVAPVKESEQVVEAEKIESLCFAPYYEWKKGDCCLDQNNNQICDNDEKVQETIIEPQTKASATSAVDTQVMLENALKKVVKISVDTVDAGEIVGSGFVVSPDGFVLSNWHPFEPIFDGYCISGSSFSDCVYITIDFKDGTKFSSYELEVAGTATKAITNVKLVGWNEAFDVALLKIVPQRNFDYFEFANSETVKTGDTVFALGSPEGLEFSTSKGVISAKNRKSFNEDGIAKYIQTDAAINQGSSGGPLIDESGKVVGVNTFGYNKAFTEGLGFALESNTVKGLYETLKQIKADIPGRICTISESGIPDCTFPITTSPRLKSVPNAEVEVTKVDLDGIKPAEHTIYGEQYSSGGTRFFSFTVAMKNKQEKTKEVCFNLKVIEEGIQKHNKILEQRISLKPNVNVQETIPVSGIQTSGDAYFEVNVVDCASPANIHGTGYARY